MPKLNERLSHWDALHGCFCGRWQKSTKKGHLYERSGENDGGAKFSRIFADVEKVAACEVCGYDLTREPMENLKAMTAKDWSGALIKGSCFYAESGWQLPEGITDCEFTACNLDNVTVPAGVTISGGCHRLLIMQNDGELWSCDWVTRLPVEPLNVEQYLLLGLSIDPADIPNEPLAGDE